MKTTLVPTPLIFVVDPTPTFPLILNATLRRAECPEVKIAAFPTTDMAVFWLSGKMDQKKAKYVFGSPWDAYPILRRPAIAIVSLSFPIDERDLVLDWLYVHYRSTKIITTSTEEERQVLGDERDELYWRCVVSHLSRPAQSTDVVKQVVPLLCL